MQAATSLRRVLMQAACMSGPALAEAQHPALELYGLAKGWVFLQIKQAPLLCKNFFQT
jgi:hypothetical protein